MSKKDERIAELEAENARLQAEVNRLNICLINTPYFPNVSFTNRCGLCGQFLSDGYGPVHQCWQWTCTSDRTDVVTIPHVGTINSMLGALR